MKSIVEKSFEKSLNYTQIPNELYKQYSVKKGLRNEDGTGVLIGLTKISDVVGYKRVDGKKIDDYGHLYYRGIDVAEILAKSKGHRFIYEEVCFLILFGYLPSREELKEFIEVIQSRYGLPRHYLEGSILGFPALDLMNKLQQEVLMLYNYDKFDADSIDLLDTVEKGINLISKIPIIVCYTYATKKYHYDKETLIIHHIDQKLSIAEQILHLLKPDGTFTEKEAEVLDTTLVLHADHGGGNNSTFTSVVISSTATDLYSALSGSIGSLKGPKHGGASLAVKRQMDKVLDTVGVHASNDKIRELINQILDKKFNDKSGLIYGIGHAVYTLSDPRAVLLSQKAYELAKEKDRLDEYDFYHRFEEIAVEEIKKRKGINVCANVDFYSGFVYDMLGIPSDLFTLLFAIARSVGWIAHNVETKLYADRIIRPATKYVGEIDSYKKREER